MAKPPPRQNGTWVNQGFGVWWRVGSDGTRFETWSDPDINKPATTTNDTPNKSGGGGGGGGGGGLGGKEESKDALGRPLKGWRLAGRTNSGLYILENANGQRISVDSSELGNYGIDPTKTATTAGGNPLTTPTTPALTAVTQVPINTAPPGAGAPRPRTATTATLPTATIPTSVPAPAGTPVSNPSGSPAPNSAEQPRIVTQGGPAPPRGGAPGSFNPTGDPDKIASVTQNPNTDVTTTRLTDGRVYSQRQGGNAYLASGGNGAAQPGDVIAPINITDNELATAPPDRQDQVRANHAPAYTGGAAVVDVEYLGNGDTVTTTATGARIQSSQDPVTGKVNSWNLGKESPAESAENSITRPIGTGSGRIPASNPGWGAAASVAKGDEPTTGGGAQVTGGKVTGGSPAGGASTGFQPTNPGWGNAATVAKANEPAAPAQASRSFSGSNDEPYKPAAPGDLEIDIKNAMTHPHPGVPSGGQKVDPGFDMKPSAPYSPAPSGATMPVPEVKPTGTPQAEAPNEMLGLSAGDAFHHQGDF